MTYQTTNPATGALLRTFPTMSNQELDKAVVHAHLAFENDWRLRSIADRAAILSKTAALMREGAEKYAQLLTLEMGKLINEARAEVGLAASILDYYAKNAAKYLKPSALPESLGAEVHTVPIGVILGIEPWNFPFYQVARVAGPQLMAGNVLLLKHAENVPQSALALAELFADAGAPANVYTNLFASVEQIGRVIEHPYVRGVTLTGSERAGAAVAEQAGRRLKKVVLEMGGSDPLIVLEDAPLDSALDGATFGRMFNTGQCCVGSKRIIVVGKERGQAFLDGFVKRLSALKVGDPTDETTGLGPLASQRGLDLLLQQIATASKHGARVVLGGSRIDRPGFYLTPTVLTDLEPDNPICMQELFGPVAMFHVVATEAEAIALANATPYGLGASVFTANLERGRKVASELDCGMVFVNQPAWTGAEVPFGGVKNSGFGRELSELGFAEFVNKKLINVAPVGSPLWGPISAA